MSIQPDNEIQSSSVTKVKRVNIDVLSPTDYGKLGKPMKVGLGFNAYTGLVVQNWSSLCVNSALYHIIRTETPSILRGGVREVSNLVTSQNDPLLSEKQAGKLYVGYSPIYTTLLQTGESFTYGDELEYYIQAVIKTVKKPGEIHGSVTKTEELLQLRPGVGGLVYTMVGDSCKISEDPVASSALKAPGGSDALRVISVRNASGTSIPANKELIIYVRRISSPSTILHELVFTSDFPAGTIKVCRSYCVEFIGDEAAPGLSGTFSDQALMFNNGLALVEAPPNPASSSTVPMFDLYYLDDLQNQATLITPSENYEIA